MIIQDQRAFDKAQRRNMRHQLAKTKDVMGLLKGDRLVQTEQRAINKFNKLAKLNAAIDIGGEGAFAAARAKRKMNVVVYGQQDAFIAEGKPDVTSIHATKAFLASRNG